PDLSVFDGLYVNNIQGTAIPLSQLASIGLESSPVSIRHHNKERTVSVSAFVQEGYLNDRVIKDVISRMDAQQLPTGYHYTMGGEVETREQSFGGFGAIIMLTAFLF